MLVGNYRRPLLGSWIRPVTSGRLAGALIAPMLSSASVERRLASNRREGDQEVLGQ
jgi:hypothetical protein